VKHCPRGSTSGPVGAALFTPPTVTEKSKDKRNKHAGVTETERQSLSIRVVHEQPLWLNQWPCGGPVHSGHRGREIEKQKKQKNAVSETLSTWLNQWPCGGCAVHSTNCDREIERQKKQTRGSHGNRTPVTVHKGRPRATLMAQPVALWGLRRRPSSLRSPWQTNRKTKETKKNAGVTETERQSLCTWLSQWRCEAAAAAQFTPVTVEEKSKDKRNKKTRSVKHCPRGSTSGAVVAQFTPLTVAEKWKDKRNKKNAGSGKQYASHCPRGSTSGAVVAQFTPVTVGKTKRNKRHCP
jgi:hypothetical protein